MNFTVYALTSVIVLFGVIAQTYIQQEQFYPTLVALSQEKLQLAVIYNFLFMNLLILVRLALKLFVGVLTPVEIEHFMESGRSIVADTILFLIFYSPTIDGKEIGTVFLIQTIGMLLVLKFFHAVGSVRVGRMFEVGVPSSFMIIRMGSMLLILLMIDISMVFRMLSLLDKASTFYTWLVFEFTNVSITSFCISLKFGFNVVDTKLSANGWTPKSVYIFYTELIGDILQMTSYIAFMGIFFYQNPSRLPIYAIADVLQVARQLANRLKSFKKYREVTRDMEARFPNPTEEEVVAAESCIICRDKLKLPGSKILQCGHIFHMECLKSWAVVQQSCPTCRADLVPLRKKEVVLSATQNISEQSASNTEVLPEQPVALSPKNAVPEEPLAKAPSIAGRSVSVQGGSMQSSVPTIQPRLASKSDIPLDQSTEQLLQAMMHARDMVEFYKSQVDFWKSESNALAVPEEPNAMKQFIEGLQLNLEGRPILPRSKTTESPALERTDPSSSSHKDELEQIRQARRKKYQENAIGDPNAAIEK